MMQDQLPSSARRLLIASDWRGDPIAARDQRSVSVWREKSSLRCVVDAPLAGDLAPADPPGRQWELWQHEVVELFIAGPQQHYLEIELGPHGHYLVLQLAGERNIVGYDLFVDYEARIENNRWRGEAAIPWELLPEPPHRVNAYAMYGVGDDRRHLALYPLAGEAPDFHQLAAFQRCEIPSL